MIGVHHEWGRLRETLAVEALAGLLEREGVTVHRCELLPRDPLIVVGDRAIEASLRRVARREECRVVRPFTTDATPPGSTNEADGPFLEGGDVLLDGRNVYVGMSGRASDLAGVDWLAARLGASHRVLAIPMRSDVEHLEEVLTLVRPGLLICCREKLVDGLPSALATWEMIAISKQEAAERAAQLLILDAQRLVAAANNARVTAELRRRGLDVVPFAFDRGLRAAHHPLLRESVLE
ncbi:MAG: hypothetical protein JOY81_08990 [Alphaproteobacteria bacterium]|nr:hypothetical protein [Alphaproteobacteria bacterium]